MNRANPVSVFLAMVLFALVATATWLSVRVDAQLPTATFLPAQAEAGKTVYEQQCASCHGGSLDNGEFGPPVRGVDFQQKWGGKTVDTLEAYLVERMPRGCPSSC